MIIGDVRILSNEEVEWRVPDLDSPEMKDGTCSPVFHIGRQYWGLWILQSHFEDLCKEFNDLSEEFKKLRKTYEYSQLKVEETEKENSDIKKERDAYKGAYKDAALSSEHYRKRYEDAQSKLERTTKELDASKTDLKATREKLALSSEHYRKRYEDAQSRLERTVKELNASKTDLKATRAKLGEQDKVLQDIKQVFEKQDHCDVVLRVRGREFQAHKAVLAARSPVFSATFRNDMKEKETGIVDIKDCDPSVFSDFLYFLYSGDVDSLSEKNVFGLFTAADKYDVTDLKTKCVVYMKENVSVDTFCETLTVALQHCETELLHTCTDFFLTNAEDILQTVKWQTFVVENPTPSNELVIRYVKSMKQSRK